MDKRRIGRSELEVRPLCLGGNVFGWTVDEAASYAVLDRFLDAGFGFIDTADVYSRWAPGNRGGESEAIVGRWMEARGCRDRVVLATKVGSDMGEGRKGLRAAYIVEAAEASLRRLRTDVIDLYQSHFDDPDAPQEETLGAYARLIEAGKVRAIGASNFSPPRLREALDLSRGGLPRYECLQPPYNLYDRDGYEAELEPLCRSQDLGVIAYYSLASGFLTGKYRSAADAEGRARGAKARSYLTPRGNRILSALDRVSEGVGANPARVALAWIIARPGITAPIASATSREQLADLLAAASLALPADAVAELDRASAPEP